MLRFAFFYSYTESTEVTQSYTEFSSNLITQRIYFFSV